LAAKKPIPSSDSVKEYSPAPNSINPASPSSRIVIDVELYFPLSPFP
jgi:hypothetical protein